MATTIYTPAMLRGAGTRGVPEIPKSGGSSFTNTYSMAFDGLDDYIAVPDIPALNAATNLTFSFWGKKATGKNLGIEAFNTSTNKVILYWWTDDVVYWGVRNTGTPTAASNALADFSNWHHFAGTYEGSSGTIKLYVDGSLVSTQTGAPAATTDLSSYFKIGKANDTNFGTGNIDEVAIWNSDQSSNITTIYNSGTPGDLTSLSPTYWNRMGD